MRKSTPSIVLLCAAAALLAQPLPAADTNTAPAPAKPAIKPSEVSADTVIAKGKGVEIKRSQLDEAVVRLKANAIAQGGAIPPDHVAMMEPGLLNRLIQSQILISKATDAEKAKAKADATKQVQEARTNAPSEEMFNTQLKAMGMTMDQLVETMAEQATAEAVILRELKVNVTDADAKKFYNDTNNAASFEQPEMVRASHILLMTQDPKTNQELSAAEKDAKRKTMEGLLKRAKAGEDFAKLAKEYSEDPGSKDKGGEYTFPRGQMVPEFEAAALALKTNEVSDIVTTQFGYHIIKLSEHTPAQKMPFDTVAPGIKKYLTQQQLAKLAPDYIAKAKKEAAVEILDEKLKQQEAPAAGLPTGHPPVKPTSDSGKSEGK
jgi:peptidyl-prolyl cis-trans isomerase C